jgi:cobalt-zinc-cadmium efflux system outer membrane protein
MNQANTRRSVDIETGRGPGEQTASAESRKRGRRSAAAWALTLGILLRATAGAAVGADASSDVRTAAAADPRGVEESSSLEAVETYALAHNPAILAAKGSWEAALQRVPQVRAYENPMVTYMPDTNNMAQTRAGPQGTGVSVSQAIPFPGKLTLRGGIADEEARAAAERVRATTQEVLRQVGTRYAQYYLAFRSLAVNREVTELARQFASIAEAKYRVGKAAQQDVILAREEISRLLADEVTFEGDRDAALGGLNSLLDRPPRAAIAAPEELQARDIGRTLASLVEEAQRNRPELQAQDHLVEASRRALRLAKMDWLPNFQIGGQYSSVEAGTNPMFTKDGQDIWVANLGISVPIWIDRIRAKIEESRAQLQQSESLRRDLANRVSDDVQRAYERARVAARTEEIYRTTLIPQTDERIGAARAGYQTGIVDFLTLIDSLKSVEKVRLERYRAVRAYQQSLADLERAIGAPVSESPTPRGEER